MFADLTCDSDGKIDQFIDQRDVKDVLELHSFQEEPYFIGLFLVGAYQEILGDLHNLFGDTDAVHVRLDVDGEVTIGHVVEGDAISEVMAYVQYEQVALVEKFRNKPRSDALMKSLDEINYRYGSSTLRLAAEGIRKGWQMRREKVSPCYTTSFNQLMIVKS